MFQKRIVKGYLKDNSNLVFGKGVPASSPREILSYRPIEFPVVCSSTICDELGTALTFYNLALFSIYGNDGTTISTSGVILNKIISLRKGSRIKPVVGH